MAAVCEHCGEALYRDEQAMAPSNGGAKVIWRHESTTRTWCPDGTAVAKPKEHL